jgi:nitrite reductase/ring-hydroxylating ferredoxin subunit
LVDGLLKGDVIECYMHRWHYNVTDGRLLDHLKGVRLNTYKVEVKGDDIYVCI